MSRLPPVCEGDIVEHVHADQRGEYPTGLVTHTGVGLVTVQPTNGAPRWIADRYEVQHTPDSPPFVPERIQ